MKSQDLMEVSSLSTLHFSGEFRLNWAVKGVSLARVRHFSLINSRRILPRKFHPGKEIENKRRKEGREKRKKLVVTGAFNAAVSLIYFPLRHPSILHPFAPLSFLALGASSDIPASAIIPSEDRFSRERVTNTSSHEFPLVSRRTKRRRRRVQKWFRRPFPSFSARASFFFLFFSLFLLCV